MAGARRIVRSTTAQPNIACQDDLKERDSVLASRMYFPLRSNARALVAGAPVDAMRRKIKLASLLHDQVLIEYGVWSGQAGPSGRVELYRPVDGDWQTSRERNFLQGHSFLIGMQLVSEPPDAPLHKVVESNSTVAWEATYAPLRREIPPGCGWICFDYAEVPKQTEKAIAEWARTDVLDPHLSKLYPDRFVREMVVNSANLDLLVGARLGAAVSFDTLHSGVVRARLQSGRARPVYGHDALNVLVPAVADLTWEDIGEVRCHRDISYLRAVLAEIEEAARAGDSSDLDVVHRIHQEYEARLLEANARLRSGLGGRLLTALIGLVVGQIAGPLVGLPLAGAVIGRATGWVVDDVLSARRKPRWLAANTAIRKIIDRERSIHPSAEP